MKSLGFEVNSIQREIYETRLGFINHKMDLILLEINALINKFDGELIEKGGEVDFAKVWCGK